MVPKLHDYVEVADLRGGNSSCPLSVDLLVLLEDEDAFLGHPSRPVIVGAASATHQLEELAHH